MVLRACIFVPIIIGGMGALLLRTSRVIRFLLRLDNPVWTRINSNEGISGGNRLTVSFSPFVPKHDGKGLLQPMPAWRCHQCKL